ncbi:hypothetical protein [Nocardioides sp.]|uniref:hypothetical protein n=1 Tax=Nocardioides sp. TaxID=35761 RepID=UPI003D1189B8
MSSVRSLVLGVVVGGALLTGCSAGEEAPRSSPARVSPSTTVYMPPEVPLESILIQGDPTSTSLDVPDRAFAHAAARLSEHYGEDYLTQGTPGTGSRGYWVVLTERPDKWAITLLARLPVDVEVKYGAPATRTELEDVRAALLWVLESHDEEFAQVTAAPSRFATRIVVHYGLVVDDTPTPRRDDAPTDHLSSFDQALAAAAAKSPDGTLALPIRFVHDPALDEPSG